MKPQISVITLAANDPEKSIACHRDGLGLPTKGIVGAEFEGRAIHAAGAVGFFELSGSLMLALYPRHELASV